MAKRQIENSCQSPPRRILASICLVAAVLLTMVVVISPDVHADNDDLKDIARERQLEAMDDTSFDISVDSDDKPPVKPPRRNSSRSKRKKDKNADGPGIEGRVGHIAFPTFGRNDSLTHVELLPYIAVDDYLLFGDTRLFIDNKEQLGGSVGLGARRWSESWNQLYGASVWYDLDQSSGKTFNSLGVSLETYGKNWEARSNFYIPVGDDQQEFSTGLINPRYSGNQILFDRFHDIGEAMEGVDLEVGVPIPSDFADDHDIRVYGGLYHFIGGTVPDIDGYKFRMEGAVTDDIATQVQFTSDDTYGTSVTFALAYEFSGGSGVNKSTARSKSYLMRRFVERNHNVIVARQVNTESNLVAINPDTGQEYVVQHVSSSASAGSGTSGDPFQSVSAAQTAGGDIILVHSGSVITSPVTLQSGDVLLGEGNDFTLNTTNLGQVAMPSATGGTTAPIIQGVTGDGVTLATNSKLIGFVVDTPTGNGIVASGINGAHVEDVTIRGTAGDGVFMENTTGSFSFTNVSIENTTGTAFHVDGGTSSSSISGSISNTAGRAVVIENTTSGTVNFSNASLSDDGGEGILLSNADGNVKFGNVTLVNSTTTGIDIQGGSGTFQFSGTTNVTDAAGTGINIDGTTGTTEFSTINVVDSSGQIGVSLANSTGTTSLGNVNITTDGGTGLFVSTGGNVSSTSGTISTLNSSAVDIEDTAVDMDLTSVSSDGAVNGIRIVDATGDFRVWGTGTLASGGVIQNSTVGVLVENSEIVGLQYLDLESNTTGLSATDSDHIILVQSRVNNSTSYGVDLDTVKTLEVWYSDFVDNGSGALRAQVDAVDTYNYTFARSVVNDSSASPLSFSTMAGGNGSNLNLSVDGNVMTTNAAGASAITLNWNGLVIGNIDGNELTGNGTSSTGLNVTTTSTTDLAQISASQNTFHFNDDNSTGMSFETSGQSQLSIGANAITFDGASGTGLNFTLAQSAEVNIFSNLIQDNTSAGMGIQFTSIDGPSNVAINDNLISLLSTDSSIDQGIIFSAVNGTIGLLGTHNNVVNGASVPFLIPVGTSTGQIIVNGTALP